MKYSYRYICHAGSKAGRVYNCTQVLFFRKHEVNLEPNFSFITVYLLSFLDIVWNLITNITLDISEFKKHIDRQKYKVP